MKPSQSMMARLRLTTKQVNGGYYKGTRTGSMGHFAKNGEYMIDYRKVRTYVVPEDLSNFKLTPFVTKKMSPTPSKYTKDTDGTTTRTERAFNGEDYIQVWVDDNHSEYLQWRNPDGKIHS